MRSERDALLAIDCERAAPVHAEKLALLFEGAGSGCFCNYWHFAGDKNAWLEQCFLHPEKNRAALEARLAGSDLCGVVALTRASSNSGEAGFLAGWMKVTRCGEVPRLYDQRVYRQLPCFQAEPGERDRVYAIGCCYVAEQYRGLGVARKLLERAVASAKEAGAAALEAFPRGLPEAERLRADELLMGPEPLFIEAGFEAVSDFRPYPVLRLTLR